MSETTDLLLLETRETVARIEAKVDTLIERTSDHEERIRANEKWRFAIPGGLLTSIAAALLAALGIHVG